MPKLSTVLAQRLIRLAAAILLVVPTLTGCATGNPPSRAAQDMAGETVPSPEKRLERLDKNAMHAAMADGITTGLALSAGALEMNPLITTSPAGLIVLTGAKIGLVKLADDLPQDEKRLVIKSSGAVWTGAAVNNLMVLLSTPTPIAIAAGVVAGVLWWRHSSQVYERADRDITARGNTPPPDEQGRKVAAIVPSP
ncbi:hypothetical protein [Massilia sp. LjRoot122]|uniref:hypothetical protein n=1 Tax=Massilia sp. LjRoot122 TaxID=3342257 RepID=UPI003ECD88C9